MHSFRLLLYLVVVVPILDLAVLFGIGRAIGAGPTLAWVLATLAAGLSLLQRAGNLRGGALGKSGAPGHLRGADLSRAAACLGAGLLLIWPGVLTDLLGIGLLLPPVRSLALRAWGLRSDSASSLFRSSENAYEHPEGPGGSTSAPQPEFPSPEVGRRIRDAEFEILKEDETSSGSR